VFFDDGVMRLDDVIHEEVDMNSNPSRTVIGLLRPPSRSPMTKVAQVRIIKVNQESQLGNHWREYGEIYGVIGEADFDLEDIETRERRKYFMKTGDSLFVPSRVALRVNAKPETTIVCCSESYDREAGTHKYPFEQL